LTTKGGKLGLAQDDRFKTLAERTSNHSTLEAILSEVFRTRPRDEWLSILERAGLVCSPVNNVEQVVNDPHVQAREMVLEVEHPRRGSLKVVGSPMKFSRTRCKIEKASPDLGEHTREILRKKLNIPQDEMERLKEDGIISYPNQNCVGPLGPKNQ